MTIDEEEYGIKIHLDDSLRIDQELLESSISDLINYVQENRVQNVLCQLDDPNPKQNESGINLIADLISNKVKQDVKIAVFSRKFKEQSKAIELESIFVEKGVSIKYFSNEDEAVVWLEN